MEIEVVFKNKAFVDLLIHIVEDLKTKYRNSLPYNCGYYNGTYYSWDCWNLVKSIIWGWEECKDVGYYCFLPDKYGLGDWNGKQILEHCTDVSSDFTYIEVGEYLLTEKADHAAIYIGEHEYGGSMFNVVECTPAWFGGVQFSYVDNLGVRKRNQYDSASWGKWKYHGKLPWVEYNYKDEKAEQKKKEREKKIKLLMKNYDNLYLQLAQEIIDGKWGNGAQRVKALNACGYDYKFAQSLVDAKLG